MDSKILNCDYFNSGFIDILKNHLQVDIDILNNPNSDFISDWQCKHPFENLYMPDLGKLDQQSANYTFYSDDKELISSIQKMHKIFGEDYGESNILPGDGSSTFIASFCMWLFKNNVTEVFYIPPMYYTFYYFLELFKIRARPISGRQAYENDFTINFPNKKSVLILCDPIWYVGQHIKQEIIEQIASWQKNTESIIFVDGSFQYTGWDGNSYEHTSRLHRDLTFRLICPTKFLAIHSYRFSYLLLPEKYNNEILYVYSSNVGSTAYLNTVFAIHAIRQMLSLERNTQLLHYISNIYKLLIENDLIETNIVPESGFFVFAKIKQNINGYIKLEQHHFEQKRFPDYVRINLLKNNILNLLLGDC